MSALHAGARGGSPRGRSFRGRLQPRRELCTHAGFLPTPAGPRAAVRCGPKCQRPVDSALFFPFSVAVWVAAGLWSRPGVITPHSCVRAPCVECSLAAQRPRGILGSCGHQSRAAAGRVKTLWISLRFRGIIDNRRWSDVSNRVYPAPAQTAAARRFFSRWQLSGASAMKASGKYIGRDFPSSTTLMRGMRGEWELHSGTVGGQAGGEWRSI